MAASRLEELRRRVKADPASVAFAALAEELRRAGLFEEAIATARTGLQKHPGYVSGHVTLARSLLGAGHPGEARGQLEFVLGLAPENLVALKTLGEVHQALGDSAAALECYQKARVLAPQDPELAGHVDRLETLLRSPRATTTGGPTGPVPAATPPPAPDAPPVAAKAVDSAHPESVPAETRPVPDAAELSAPPADRSVLSPDVDTPVVDMAPPPASGNEPAVAETAQDLPDTADWSTSTDTSLIVELTGGQALESDATAAATKAVVASESPPADMLQIVPAVGEKPDTVAAGEGTATSAASTTPDTSGPGQPESPATESGIAPAPVVSEPTTVSGMPEDAHRARQARQVLALESFLAAIERRRRPQR